MIFLTTLQRKTKIIIDPNESMNVLIKFYLEKMKKPELLGNPNIRFVKNAEPISPNSKNLIKDYIKNKNDPLIIMVDDVDDKIGHA